MYRLIIFFLFVFINVHASDKNILIYDFQKQFFFEGHFNNHLLEIDSKKKYFSERSKKIQNKINLNSILVYEKVNSYTGDLVINEFSFKFDKKDNSFIKVNGDNYFVESYHHDYNSIIDYINLPYVHGDKVIKLVLVIFTTDDSFMDVSFFKSYIAPFLFIIIIFLISFAFAKVITCISSRICYLR